MSEPVTLDDFVAQTLTDIINGVRKAQGFAASNGAIVDPPHSSGVAGARFDAATGRIGQAVTFDVAAGCIMPTPSAYRR